MVFSFEERRQSTRCITENLQVSIADNRLYYPSKVENISVSGIKLSNIHTDFNENAGVYTCILYAPNKLWLNVDLLLKWVKEMKDGRYKIAGLKIHSPPHLWREFIMQTSDLPTRI